MWAVLWVMGCTSAGWLALYFVCVRREWQGKIRILEWRLMLKTRCGSKEMRDRLGVEDEYLS